MDTTVMPYYRKGRTCANCGSPVSDRGRSKTGEFFCAVAECKLERNRRRQARLRAQTDDRLRGWREKYVAVDPSLPLRPPSLWSREDIDAWTTLVELRREQLKGGTPLAEVDAALPIPLEWR